MIGIHHVSSIAGDPQRNLGFYAGTLGLRLVKLTVNFDDPGTYHLYYGDESGNPGSLVTFFPWGREGRAGRVGLGQVSVTSLAIPPSAVGYWINRLISHNVAYQGPSRRFDEQVISFKDPDGLLVELIADKSAEGRPGWSGGKVPGESAIRGIHSVTLLEAELEPVSKVLTEVLGFRQTRSEETRWRFEGSPGAMGGIVDVRASGGFWSGAMGVGAVHHVAFRTPDEETQLAVRAAVLAHTMSVTKVMNREYFTSIYFREPGGVLFESATDGPGMTIDEPLDRLGSELKLPPWLEGERASVEQRLPHLELEG